ncbi:putative nuclease HARBI1 [Hydra vulgaris]|uniref:Putative nuclease HARBI1 n=1 Tax=Hydra vulgaris TaxID=6087 RepID=A0ABM4B9A4_HYDVU
MLLAWISNITPNIMPLDNVKMDISIILTAHGQDHLWRETQHVALSGYSNVECIQKLRLLENDRRDIVNTLRNDLSPITLRSNPISSEAKVLIALRFLSTGSFQAVIGDTSHVSQSSYSRILHQFCKIFIQHYHYLVRWYDSPEEMTKTKRKYFQSFGVKGLFGVIDGTMIQIKGVTGADEPAYICRKGYPALNCQVVIEADEKFRGVVAKYPGSCHDAFVFSNSALKQTLEYDPRQGFLFADSGYGLSPVLITPFNKPTTPEEIYFNKVHRQVRSDVERAIGRLKNHRRCLHKSGGTLQYTPTIC